MSSSDKDTEKDSPDEAAGNLDAAREAEKEEGTSSSDDSDTSEEEESDGSTDEDESEEAEEQKEAPAPARSSGSSILIAVLCLAAGFGIGWFGHDYQGKQAIKKADASVEGKGEGARGPCKDWEDAICTELGDKAFACNQAKAASALLTGSACLQAKAGLPKKLEAIQAERAKCTEMQTKLCAELGEESNSCKLVKDQTPSFPPERCEQMMTNYDQVLQQLKMMEQRGAIPGARPPGHPGTPGTPPPGVARPPGAGGPPGAAPGPSAPSSSAPPAKTP